MKDALIAAENGGNASVPICEIEGLLREAHFIPETRNIDSLFKEMQSQKIHMVIVVDEYGQTAGIVTMAVSYTHLDVYKRQRMGDSLLSG